MALLRHDRQCNKLWVENEEMCVGIDKLTLSMRQKCMLRHSARTGTQDRCLPAIGGLERSLGATTTTCM